MQNGYGLGEVLKNIVSVIYTKIFYKGARLIRRPIHVRGKKFLKYGSGFTTGYNCRLEMFENYTTSEKKLIVGENCKIGDFVHIAAAEKIIIGNNCLMASKVYISDISHGNYSGSNKHTSPEVTPDDRIIYTKPISIGDNVWIGENVCILSGVNIGTGCVVGANAVVNKDIPDYCIAVGVPAIVIKHWNMKLKIWEKI
jgi:acetyltransferase-like isoleucine patch superfamily enzyme